jgi:hypothetical protein
MPMRCVASTILSPLEYEHHSMTELPQNHLDRVDLTLEVVTQAQLDFAVSLQMLTQRMDGITE